MLQKIFIKDYKNINDRKVRSKYGTLAGVFGIVTNLFLCTIKIIIGLAASSVTIMADGFNNLSDSLSSVITLIGFYLAKRKADKDHPFGHARYEYLTGTLIAYFIFLMGLFFLKESVDKIISPQALHISVITYIVLIIAILIKLFQMYIYLDLANDSKSQTIKASAYDSRNDAIATTTVLISMIVMSLFNINIDGIMGLLVSLFIIYSSISLIKEMIDPLLGQKATKEQVDLITKKLLKYEDIKGIHDLVIHNYGETTTFVTVHAEVDDKMTLIEANTIMDNIEIEFFEKYNIYLTIHTDPVNSNDKLTNNLKKEVKNILKKFDKTLTLHDFRVVSAKDHTKVIFDVVIPYDKNYKKEDLQEILNKSFKDKTKYYFLIKIDRPFY